MALEATPGKMVSRPQPRRLYTFAVNVLT